MSLCSDGMNYILQGYKKWQGEDGTVWRALYTGLWYKVRLVIAVVVCMVCNDEWCLLSHNQHHVDCDQLADKELIKGKETNLVIVTSEYSDDDIEVLAVKGSIMWASNELLKEHQSTDYHLVDSSTLKLTVPDQVHVLPRLSFQPCPYILRRKR